MIPDLHHSTPQPAKTALSDGRLRGVCLVVLFLAGAAGSSVSAEILAVPAVTQEQDQWCWAGVSNAILSYYGNPVSQCEIAEYTRTHADWRDFGPAHCCSDPAQGCNYWNYNWGENGSIEDILKNWGVESYGYSSALTLPEVEREIKAHRPFIIRWGWTGGGGHFLVGHGLENGMLHYMDPWYSEGLKVAVYDWVVAGSTHTWTDTNVMTSNKSTPDISSPDFNKDGRADILWSNNVTGQTSVWYMQGVVKSGWASLPSIINTKWAIVGVADFNTDSQPDILWRNGETGENYMWYMNGTTRMHGEYLLTISDTRWEIAGVGDLNADSRPDILWSNTTTGHNRIWYMSGATKVWAENLPPVADTNWRIAGIADFNADSMPDILWRNGLSGQNYVWYMNGAKRSGGAYLKTVSNTSWAIVGVSDFNTDGQVDILWRNSASGENGIWYMKGVSFTNWASLPSEGNTEWKIVNQ